MRRVRYDIGLPSGSSNVSRVPTVATTRRRSRVANVACPCASSMSTSTWNGITNGRRVAQPFTEVVGAVT